MSKATKTLSKVADESLKIERYFDEDSNLTFNMIADSIIREVIDSLLSESYHTNEVNIATSLEEEVV